MKKNLPWNVTWSKQMDLIVFQIILITYKIKTIYNVWPTISGPALRDPEYTIVSCFLRLDSNSYNDIDSDKIILKEKESVCLCVLVGLRGGMGDRGVKSRK